MKERYITLCESERSIPLFAQPWWLDATCGAAHWDVVLAESNGDIVGALPYQLNEKFGFSQLTQPKLTQFLGPWIKVTSVKHSKKTAREKEILTDLITRLPKFSYYNQAWSPQVTNWLPFYWQGFKQTTRYTLRLENISDLESVWKGFQDGARGDIRKAETRFSLRIDPQPCLKTFLKLNSLVFKRQGLRVPYDEALVERIDSSCKERSCRAIFLAKDAENQSHAAVYIVWDANCAYYLLGGSDPELRNSGAMSFCIWEAIKFASTVTHTFDFEGSMIEPVEKFFRSFGAMHATYHYVSKARSPVLKLLKAINDAR